MLVTMREGCVIREAQSSVLQPDAIDSTFHLEPWRTSGCGWAVAHGRTVADRVSRGQEFARGDSAEGAELGVHVRLVVELGLFSKTRTNGPGIADLMTRKGIFVPPGGGRAYPMGRIASMFLADGAETDDRYSISEWWLEPNTKGPGPHMHDEDDVFYVIEGTMSILLGDRWIDAPRGSLVLAPGGMTHDFENRGETRAGVLNVSVPGNFESSMPEIAQWFREHPPGNAR